MAGGDFDREFHGQVGGDLLHEGLHETGDFAGARLVAFDDKRVVNLHDEVGAVRQAFCHGEHGALHEVGFGALDGHILGGALRGFADEEVWRINIRGGAAAAVEGLDVALFPRLTQELVELLFDGGAKLEVVVDELLGFGDGHVGGIGEAFGAHAVENAKIDNLGGAALVLSDLVHRDMESLGGGFGVDVEVAIEIVDKGLVMANSGGEAKLKLRVVGRDEDAARGRNEASTDAAAFVGADGDVLEVGVFGAEAPSSGDVLSEGGVDAARFVGEGGEGGDVGVEEFGGFAILNNSWDNGVGGLQLFELGGASGVAFGGFFDAFGGKLQLGEKDFGELRGGVGVKIGASEGLNLTLKGGDLVGIFGGEASKIGAVDQHAFLLHLVEDGDEGEV